MEKAYNFTQKMIYTDSGDKMRLDYVKDFDKEGNEILVECGKTDLQALYDSYASQCDLSIVIKTMIQNGFNPSNAKIVYADDVDDVVDLQRAGTSGIFKASVNYENNKKLIEEYEAKVAALKKQNEDIKEGANNANNE